MINKHVMKVLQFFNRFTKNRYFDIYTAIICNAINSDRSKGNGAYYEKHHIIPKSMAPEYANLSEHPWNGVLLTAKEHFISHRLLCKITTGDDRKAALGAYNMVCFHTRRATLHNPTSLQYRKAREAAALAASGPRGMDVPSWSSCETLDEFKMYLTKLVNDGISDPKIGKINGVSAVAINNWRRKLGIENRRGQLRNKEWLRNQYEILGRTSTDIGDELGCTATAVTQYLHRFKIVTKKGNTKFDKNSKLRDTKWLKDQVSEGRSIADIANEIGCSKPTAKTAIGHLRYE